MTLTRLKSTNNTRFLTNFKLSVKSGRKILIVLSVLQLLGLPVMAAVAVSAAADDGGNSAQSQVAFILISIFCLAAAVLCGIIIAVNNFSYLYKKSQVDMIYSLPIKKKFKFLSDYASGLVIYIVTYIVACIICNFILFCGRVCVDELTEIFSDGSLMTLVMQGEFAGLLVMIMLYTLSVLVLSCCGTLFESIMNIFMINGLIPGAISVVAAMLFANLYGVPIFETVAPVLGYTSPLGAVIYMIYVLGSEEYIYSSEVFSINAGVYGKWVLFFLGATALYFLLTMFLYNRRKAEDVSKPYVFKLLYYIVVTVISMAISLIARYQFSMIFPVIIFSFIVYMIFEVITNRGFKKIYKSLIRYAVTMVGILIICVAAIGTRGFGVEGKTYSPSRVKSVEVSYGGIDNIMDLYSAIDGYSMSMYMENGNLIEYKDSEIIEKITQVQKDAIKTYRSGEYGNYSSMENIFYQSVYYEGDYDLNYEESYDYPCYDITFRFNLKTGGKVKRNYQLSFNQIKELFILDSTEELAERRADYLYDSLIREFNNNKYKVYTLNYNYIKNNYSDTEQISMNPDEAKQLKENYRLDYLESSLDELSSSRVVCYVNGNIPIRECFERTISFIKNHGGLEISSHYPYYMLELEGILYPPEGFESWGRNDVTATFGYVKVMESLGHVLTNGQTLDLLKYATSSFYAEEDCYVMEINGEYYAVPAENSQKAAKLYEDSRNKVNRYEFDEFMEDLSYYSDADAFINDLIDGDYYFYADIEKAMDMRWIRNVGDFSEYSRNLGNDVSEEAKQTWNEFNLLKKFFNFTSLEEYKYNADEKGESYDINSLENEWIEYKEAFPAISSKSLK